MNWKHTMSVCLIGIPMVSHKVAIDRNVCNCNNTFWWTCCARITDKGVKKHTIVLTSAFKSPNVRSAYYLGEIHAEE